jgi:transglutaminase-like putative cysteine protease
MELPVWLQTPDLIPASVAAEIRMGNVTLARQALEKLAAEAERDPTSGALAAAARGEVVRLGRLQREYSLSPLDLLEKLREKIPSVNSSDLDFWRGEGDLNHAVLDGQLRYHRREPSGLFRLSEEAAALRDEMVESPDRARRRAPRPPRREALTTTSILKRDPSAESRARNQQTTNPHSLVQHIPDALAAARDQQSTHVLPRTFRVSHRIRVLPGRVPPGETVRCWIPIPRDMRAEGTGPQSGPGDLVTTPGIHRTSRPVAPMATVYLEQPAALVGEPTVFAVSYVYSTAARIPLRTASLETSTPPNLDRADVAQGLLARPPHVPSDVPEFVEMAWSIAGHDAPPLTRAWRLWTWLDQHVRWVPELEYAVLTRIAHKALLLRQADCGVQSLLYMTLCRAVGVPARWQSGWVTRPGAWNLHDWVEIHVEPWGWIPVDPSFGRRDSPDPGIRDFFFGHLDAYRMVANLDYGQPFDPPMVHPRADTVDNQRGEVEWSGGSLFYDDWTYEVNVDGID